MSVVYRIDPSDLNRNWDCRYYALRHRKEKIYFFDKDFIWRSIPIENAVSQKIKGINYIDGNVEKLFGRDSNRNVTKKIMCRLKEGDHITRLLSLAETIVVCQRTHEECVAERKSQSEVDQFVISIRKPEIYRAANNKRTATFDFVEIFVLVRSEFPDKISFIKNHQKELVQLVIQKIQEDKKFQKFGVPVSVLRLTDLRLLQGDTIRYLFEIKKVKGK